MGPAVAHHGANGPDHDLGVAGEGPVLGVAQVEGGPIPPRTGATATDLPPAGLAGFDEEAPTGVLGDLAGQRGREPSDIVPAGTFTSCGNSSIEYRAERHRLE